MRPDRTKLIGVVLTIPCEIAEDGIFDRRAAMRVRALLHAYTEVPIQTRRSLQ
jgi:hypothetical protein